MKKVTIVSPCYNEQENIIPLYTEIMKALEPEYSKKFIIEILFIDNKSSDRTRDVIRQLASEDKRVKAIFNVRNFGHLRSPYHAFLQADGDAVIHMSSDLQDPPAMLREFLDHWEQGTPMVLGVKHKSRETFLMSLVRKVYYRIVNKISNVELINDFTGYGLYDRKVVDMIKKINDPYPYFRGLICELGYPYKLIPFVQPNRIRGFSKNNFYTLYDLGMLAVVSHSKVPLRLATFCGFTFSIVSFFISFGYLVAKLLFWETFSFGLAPLLIGFFFLGSIQLLAIGIIGEYLGVVLTNVKRVPLVVEEERINFN